MQVGYPTLCHPYDLQQVSGGGGHRLNSPLILTYISVPRIYLIEETQKYSPPQKKKNNPFQLLSTLESLNLNLNEIYQKKPKS